MFPLQVCGNRLCRLVRRIVQLLRKLLVQRRVLDRRRCGFEGREREGQSRIQPRGLRMVDRVIRAKVRAIRRVDVVVDSVRGGC